ncbi:hypothetical protein [Acetanaerobacterium elongatum]|uniref:Uncharacterized protein n=1 Tax=Acetanaerobacterium elongatum TaxID=258515 RepID=A0A1G9VA67_9FIRM|nr:hypothetical protein [Acetanaerobacterium elongatum]SDM68983.1 hypothetical protein SAMN05192585_103104 [Acetanaerobacterium elongatum]
MNCTLFELGHQYLYESNKVNARIRQLRAQLKTAPLGELRGLEERIDLLYREHSDLRKTGYYLINYYDRGHADVQKLSG